MGAESRLSGDLSRRYSRQLERRILIAIQIDMEIDRMIDTITGNLSDLVVLPTTEFMETLVINQTGQLLYYLLQNYDTEVDRN